MAYRAMEDDDSITSSDEENLTNLKGYQFEPQRETDEEAVEASSDSDSNEDAESQITTGRLEADDIDWCNCKNCEKAFLKREIECLCCHESPQSRSRTVNKGITNCITDNEEFKVLCLNDIVLRNVLTALNHIRGDHWGTTHPVNNRALRYAAYRQYIWWVYGKLGFRRRKVIPACVTNRIRTNFPKGPEEEYEGYHSTHEDSD